MGSSPYIPFYPSDWLAGTRMLTATEAGVYIALVCMIYEREAPLNMDHDRLARLCGCSPKAFRTALANLMKHGKIVMLDGGLWNERAAKELRAREEKRKSSSVGGYARWEKEKQKQAQADANASAAQCGNDANQNQNQNQKEEAELRSAHTREATSEGFRVRVLAAMGVGPDGVIGPSQWTGTPADMATAARWLAPPPEGLGLTETEVCEVIADRTRRRRGAPIVRWSWYDGPMAQYLAARNAPPPEPQPYANGTDHARPDPRKSARDEEARRVANIIHAAARM